MISGVTFVYLSASDWSAPWHGPQEVATAFARAGNRVLYVESLGWRRPSRFDAPRIARRIAAATTSWARRRQGVPEPGIEIISPLLIPGPRSSAAQAVNRRLLVRALRRRLRAEDRPLVLWIYTPSHASLDLVGALDEDLAVYHCTQGHVHRPFAPPDTAEVERALEQKVHAVVTDGILLHRERAGRHRCVYRIPSGVHVELHRDARPAAWAHSLPRPVVGYLGTVDHRIDPHLLAAVGRTRPDWTLAVVGPVIDLDVDELSSLPNVIIRGAVPFHEVPPTLAAFDVGIMPYADQAMTAYTYPAKLHQYLAAGLPIASTPLPDLAEFDELVEIGSGSAGMIAAIERALAAPRHEEERRAVASRNTWEHRFQALSAVVEGHLSKQPPPSSEDFRP